MKVLFGNEVTTEQARAMFKAKSPTQKGYAALPGTGPKDETCGSCKHIHRASSGRYRKCLLMRRIWTGGLGTDIKAKAPACRRWEKPDE